MAACPDRKLETSATKKALEVEAYATYRFPSWSMETPPVERWPGKSPAKSNVLNAVGFIRNVPCGDCFQFAAAREPSADAATEMMIDCPSPCCGTVADMSWYPSGVGSAGFEASYVPYP